MAGDESGKSKEQEALDRLHDGIPVDPVRAALIEGLKEPPEQPIEQPTNLEPAQFERWLPPAMAIKMLDPVLSENQAKHEIHTRLCGGEVLSNARTANWYARGSVEVHDYGRIGAFLWKVNKAPVHYDLFWKTGSYTLIRPDRPGSIQGFEVECFGIRFDPEGIDGILRDCGAAPLGTASTTTTTHAAASGPASRRKAQRLVGPSLD